MTLTVPPKPRTWPKTALIAAAFLAFTVLTCLPAIGGVELDFASIAKNWRNGATKMAQLLQPDFAFLPRTIAPMLETLQMAFVGAVFAAVASVPLTLWAARPTNPNGIARRLVRVLINVIRAVPDLVWATILVALTGVGALPGLLTLFLFDIGVIVKLVSEAIDSDEHPYLEAGRAAGGTQFQLNRALALPQSLPLFWNQWLYALELNVRISAVLGIVGAGGIGRLLNERFGFYAYDDVSIIILEILVVVVLIEVCSNLLRRRLT
ncbi:phosphonate ABC transporter, permease protein PhnE [Microbacterium halophytorum]|uniref:phosphonate ABC transporter, permease protein PhnE n=1 Tax=Microbacterium halophytorum TaxID=2067568 RepID=UPI000CFAE23D|nr:phosphonate ABC transporter, permease protein PhnE [Microbacterium halophytorum]